MAPLLSFIGLLVIVSAPSINQALESGTMRNGNKNASANSCESKDNQEMLMLFGKTPPIPTKFLDMDKKMKRNIDQINHPIADDHSIELVEDTWTKIISEVFEMDGTSDEMNVTETWIQTGRQLKGVSSQLRSWLLGLLEIWNEADLSPECSASLEDLVVDFMKTKTYAVKVLDSWGKTAPGIFEHTSFSLGNYDECLSIHVRNQQNGEACNFQGKYCMIHYQVTIPVPKRLLTAHEQIFNFAGTPLQGKIIDNSMQDIGFQHGRPNRLGICVPSSCSRDDIQGVIDIVSKTMDEIQMKVKHCEMLESSKWTTYQIVILTVLGIQIVLVGIGTLVDSFTNDILRTKGNKIQKLKNFILCFSLRINCEDLFNTTPLKDDISALHGIRVLSMVWMIYGHTYFMIENVFSDNRRAFLREIRTFFVQGITSGFLLVDNFFFITGFILTSSFFRKFRNSEFRFNILQTFFNRIYRIFVPLTFLMMFTFVWVNLAHGPMWHEVAGIQVEICKRTWWATVLFFDNFLKHDDKCHEFSWYVGADIQLFTFIFIPAFLLALKWRRATMPVFVSIVALGAIISAIFITLTGFPPIILYIYVSYELLKNIADVVHFTSWFHIVPYALGMITGYAFHKKSKASIPAVFRLITLAFSGLVFFSAYFWLPHLWSNNRLNGIWWFTFFGAFHKLLFAFSLMGIVYLCATDNGGLVNKILSYRAFLPLSRICYGMYLIHLLVIKTRMGLAVEFGFYNKYNMFCGFLINVLFSFILGIPFYLICEAPFASLHKKYLTNIFDHPQITIRKAKTAFLKDK